VSEIERPVGPNEAARRIGVGPTTVQRWIDAGLIPAHRTPGGHRRVRPADLHEFARRRGLPVRGAGAPGARRVLVVDDDRDLLDAMALRIRATRPDVEVLLADSGFKAGYFVSRYRPAAVLLDIRMPALSGIEVCRIIKGDPATAGARVVGITASHLAAEVRDLRAAGAEEVLLKPFDWADFTNVLDRILPAEGPAAAESGPPPGGGRAERRRTA
jgi:excisionase family DNA binding protein